MPEPATNFLAHAYLARHDDALRVGGLIGDFVKGPLPAGLPAALAAGVRLHRAIDSFADRHPAFNASRARLGARWRRVSGVMVDMFYDHFLACHWVRLHDEPLKHFTAETYALAQQFDTHLPARFAALLPRMRADDWLASYADAATIAHALDRIAQRLREPALLTGSGAALHEQRAALEADFLQFLPDAAAFARGTV